MSKLHAVPFNNFNSAIDSCLLNLKMYGGKVTSPDWQGIHSERVMWEMMDINFRVLNIPSNLAVLQDQIKPNLPWAEDHFRERVRGAPDNPGCEYKNWPFYPKNSARDEQIRPDGKFTHTYMERYWPKEAGDRKGRWDRANEGIRFVMGDLDDLINLLERNPETRQAFLPVWFPEDTGAVHRGRVPCTLGYLFSVRNNRISITYYIRACDALRHFRDDIYMTVRLLQYVLGELNRLDPVKWESVSLGDFKMHIESFHVFYPERNQLYDKH